MAEKLIVKDFAGIKDLEIDIKRINVLIGPQASGKSVCAKLLFYFKNFVWKILSNVEDEQSKSNLDSKYSKVFEEYFPPDSWGDHDFLIRYEVTSVFIEVSRKHSSKGKIVLKYSDFFKIERTKLRTLLKKAKEQSPGRDSEFDRIDRLFTARDALRNYLVESLCTSIGKEAAFTQLFIPAGRSFFANLQSSIFSFLSSNNAIDPFLRSFGSTYEKLKAIRFRTRDKSADGKEILDEINKLIEEALCGKHVREKNKDFLEVLDGRRIDVASSSSGQQETLPLTVVLASLPFLTSSRAGGQTVYIEEPEAHLFPSAQRSVVELIATVFNYRVDKLQFFVTTHSPYVLTALNNLLQAGLLYEENKQDLSLHLEKVVPRYKSLSPSDLSAYVLKNGRCSNIVRAETGLIDAAIIDSVSDDLAIEFDKLLSLA